MLKVALIGAGKMGISHLSILGAHNDVEVVGVCDSSKLIMDVLDKYTSFKCFTEYTKMVESTNPDAVFVALPTKYHYDVVKYLLEKNIHVFAEKPFCLNHQESKELADISSHKKLINQVGYHNKFVGTFQEVKRIVKKGFLGEINHFQGEAYGPVVIKKNNDTWRSDPKEGGGCLLDYASHVIDLLNDILSPINICKGAIVKSIYSSRVDDAVYALVGIDSVSDGLISVNWSDETYRKMSTSVTIYGSKGKIISDANELKVYFKGNNFPSGYTKGWNVRYVTDLTEEVGFYLRGEEYSAQIDYFIKAIQGKVPNNINTFESAFNTNSTISLIRNCSN